MPTGVGIIDVVIGGIPCGGITEILGPSAAVALAPPGPVWIGEAKVTIKMKNTGMEMPIAITRASRTDLINATVKRGHIGLTFDLDKLFMGK